MRIIAKMTPAYKYNYKKIDMPTQELIDYYYNLKSSKRLGKSSYAKGIAEKLDAIVGMYNDEKYPEQLGKIKEEIDNSNILNKSTSRYLRTKLSCIEIIECSSRIENFQNEIENKLKIKKYTANDIGVYENVDSYDIGLLSSYIYITRFVINTIKAKDTDKKFKNKVLTIFENKVKGYYSIFNLYSKSNNDNKKDKSKAYVLCILSFIISVIVSSLLFWWLFLK